jgi:hypothetical protein
MITQVTALATMVTLRVLAEHVESQGSPERQEKVKSQEEQGSQEKEESLGEGKQLLTHNK